MYDPARMNALAPYQMSIMGAPQAVPPGRRPIPATGLHPMFPGGVDFAGLPQGLPTGPGGGAMHTMNGAVADPNAYRAAIQAWRGQRPGMFDWQQYFTPGQGFDREGFMGAMNDWQTGLADWRGQRPTRGSF